jgi:hypothetical protein
MMAGAWPTERKAALARDRAVLQLRLDAELNFPKQSRRLGPASMAELRLEARKRSRKDKDACPFIGVHRSNAKSGGWIATLTVEGTPRTIGRFETPEKAAEWRERAVVYYTGQKAPAALRNFPGKRVRAASLATLRKEYLEWCTKGPKKIRYRVPRKLGVHQKRGGLFAGAVNVGDRTLEVGSWRTEREAALARDRAVLYFELALELNFPQKSRALGPATPAELRREARSKTRRARGKSRYIGVGGITVGRLARGFQPWWPDSQARAFHQCQRSRAVSGARRGVLRRAL